MENKQRSHVAKAAEMVVGVKIKIFPKYAYVAFHIDFHL